jgi:L-fucose dehydrogenase
MELELQNKVIVIAGRGTPMEKEIALVLSEEGAQVVLTSQREVGDHSIQQIATATGNNIFSVRVDLMVPDSCYQAINLINHKFGRIDGLVNCAGESDNLDNLVGDYVMTHISLPYLKSAEGTILNLSFGNRDRGINKISDYEAANGGREALTREWAVELLHERIRVNAIIIKGTGLVKRAATFEIANSVAFFMSARTSHVTGQLIQIHLPAT